MVWSNDSNEDVPDRNLSPTRTDIYKHQLGSTDDDNLVRWNPSTSSTGSGQSIPELAIGLDLPNREIADSVNITFAIEPGQQKLSTQCFQTFSHTEFHGSCPLPTSGGLKAPSSIKPIKPVSKPSQNIHVYWTDSSQHIRLPDPDPISDSQSNPPSPSKTKNNRKSKRPSDEEASTSSHSSPSSPSGRQSQQVTNSPLTSILTKLFIARQGLVSSVQDTIDLGVEVIEAHKNGQHMGDPCKICTILEKQQQMQQSAQLLDEVADEMSEREAQRTGRSKSDVTREVNEHLKRVRDKDKTHRQNPLVTVKVKTSFHSKNPRSRENVYHTFNVQPSYNNNMPASDSGFSYIANDKVDHLDSVGGLNNFRLNNLPISANAADSVQDTPIQPVLKNSSWESELARNPKNYRKETLEEMEPQSDGSNYPFVRNQPSDTDFLIDEPSNVNFMNDEPNKDPFVNDLPNDGNFLTYEPRVRKLSGWGPEIGDLRPRSNTAGSKSSIPKKNMSSVSEFPSQHTIENNQFDTESYSSYNPDRSVGSRSMARSNDKARSTFQPVASNPPSLQPLPTRSLSQTSQTLIVDPDPTNYNPPSQTSLATFTGSRENLYPTFTASGIVRTDQYVDVIPTDSRRYTDECVHGQIHSSTSLSTVLEDHETNFTSSTELVSQIQNLRGLLEQMMEKIGTTTTFVDDSGSPVARGYVAPANSIASGIVVKKSVKLVDIPAELDPSAMPTVNDFNQLIQVYSDICKRLINLEESLKESEYSRTRLDTRRAKSTNSFAKSRNPSSIRTISNPRDAHDVLMECLEQLLEVRNYLEAHSLHDKDLQYELFSPKKDCCSIPTAHVHGAINGFSMILNMDKTNNNNKDSLAIFNRTNDSKIKEQRSKESKVSKPGASNENQQGKSTSKTHRSNKDSKTNTSKEDLLNATTAPGALHTNPTIMLAAAKVNDPLTAKLSEREPSVNVDKPQSSHWPYSPSNKSMPADDSEYTDKLPLPCAPVPNQSWNRTPREACERDDLPEDVPLLLSRSSSQNDEFPDKSRSVYFVEANPTSRMNYAPADRSSQLHGEDEPQSDNQTVQILYPNLNDGVRYVSGHNSMPDDVENVSGHNSMPDDVENVSGLESDGSLKLRGEYTWPYIPSEGSMPRDSLSFIDSDEQNNSVRNANSTVMSMFQDNASILPSNAAVVDDQPLTQKQSEQVEESIMSLLQSGVLINEEPIDQNKSQFSTLSATESKKSTKPDESEVKEPMVEDTKASLVSGAPPQTTSMQRKNSFWKRAFFFAPSAKCAREDTLNAPSNSRFPYSNSIESLPLNDDDYKIVNERSQRLQQELDVKKNKSKTSHSKRKVLKNDKENKSKKPDSPQGSHRVSQNYHVLVPAPLLPWALQDLIVQRLKLVRKPHHWHTKHTTVNRNRKNSHLRESDEEIPDRKKTGNSSRYVCEAAPQTVERKNSETDSHCSRMPSVDSVPYVASTASFPLSVEVDSAFEFEDPIYTVSSDSLPDPMLKTRQCSNCKQPVLGDEHKRKRIRPSSMHGNNIRLPRKEESSQTLIGADKLRTEKREFPKPSFNSHTPQNSNNRETGRKTSEKAKRKEPRSSARCISPRFLEQSIPEEPTSQEPGVSSIDKNPNRLETRRSTQHSSKIPQVSYDPQSPVRSLDRTRGPTFQDPKSPSVQFSDNDDSLDERTLEVPDVSSREKNSNRLKTRRPTQHSSKIPQVSYDPEGSIGSLDNTQGSSFPESKSPSTSHFSDAKPRFQLSTSDSSSESALQTLNDKSPSIHHSSVSTAPNLPSGQRAQGSAKPYRESEYEDSVSSKSSRLQFQSSHPESVNILPTYRRVTEGESETSTVPPSYRRVPPYDCGQSSLADDERSQSSHSIEHKQDGSISDQSQTSTNLNLTNLNRNSTVQSGPSYDQDRSHAMLQHTDRHEAKNSRVSHGTFASSVGEKSGVHPVSLGQAYDENEVRKKASHSHQLPTKEPHDDGTNAVLPGKHHLEDSKHHGKMPDAPLRHLKPHNSSSSFIHPSLSAAENERNSQNSRKSTVHHANNGAVNENKSTTLTQSQIKQSLYENQQKRNVASEDSNDDIKHTSQPYNDRKKLEVSVSVSVAGLDETKVVVASNKLPKSSSLDENNSEGEHVKDIYLVAIEPPTSGPVKDKIGGLHQAALLAEYPHLEDSWNTETAQITEIPSSRGNKESVGKRISTSERNAETPKTIKKITPVAKKVHSGQSLSSKESYSKYGKECCEDSLLTNKPNKELKKEMKRTTSPSKQGFSHQKPGNVSKEGLRKYTASTTRRGSDIERKHVSDHSAGEEESDNKSMVKRLEASQEASKDSVRLKNNAVTPKAKCAVKKGAFKPVRVIPRKTAYSNRTFLKDKKENNGHNDKKGETSEREKLLLSTKIESPLIPESHLTLPVDKNLTSNKYFNENATIVSHKNPFSYMRLQAKPNSADMNLSSIRRLVETLVKEDRIKGEKTNDLEGVKTREQEPSQTGRPEQSDQFSTGNRMFNKDVLSVNDNSTDTLGSSLSTIKGKVGADQEWSTAEQINYNGDKFSELRSSTELYTKKDNLSKVSFPGRKSLQAVRRADRAQKREEILNRRLGSSLLRSNIEEETQLNSRKPLESTSNKEDCVWRSAGQEGLVVLTAKTGDRDRRNSDDSTASRERQSHSFNMPNRSDGLSPNRTNRRQSAERDRKESLSSNTSDRRQSAERDRKESLSSNTSNRRQSSERDRKEYLSNRENNPTSMDSNAVETTPSPSTTYKRESRSDAFKFGVDESDQFSFNGLCGKATRGENMDHDPDDPFQKPLNRRSSISAKRGSDAKRGSTDESSNERRLSTSVNPPRRTSVRIVSDNEDDDDPESILLVPSQTPRGTRASAVVLPKEASKSPMIREYLPRASIFLDPRAFDPKRNLSNQTMIKVFEDSSGDDAKDEVDDPEDDEDDSWPVREDSDKGIPREIQGSTYIPGEMSTPLLDGKPGVTSMPSTSFSGRSIVKKDGKFNAIDDSDHKDRVKFIDGKSYEDNVDDDGGKLNRPPDRVTEGTDRVCAGNEFDPVEDHLIKEVVGSGNLCLRKPEDHNDTRQIIWALAKVSIFPNGTRHFEILEASMVPPGHFFVSDANTVQKIRQQLE